MYIEKILPISYIMCNVYRYKCKVFYFGIVHEAIKIKMIIKYNLYNYISNTNIIHKYIIHILMFISNNGIQNKTISYPCIKSLNLIQSAAVISP